MSLASFIAALSVSQALAQGWWTSLHIQVSQWGGRAPCALHMTFIKDVAGLWRNLD
jgi:hypothetical protein